MPNTVPALLALEIERVLRDVAERRVLLVELWGMHRQRAPMADAAFSRWKTLRSEELDQLAPHEVVRVDLFYLALEQWLDYLSTTEDMPLHLDNAWREHYAALAQTGMPPSPSWAMGPGCLCRRSTVMGEVFWMPSRCASGVLGG